MQIGKPPLAAFFIFLALLAAGLRLAFFGISVNCVPESSDEALSPLQAGMIVDEHRTPLLVMANPYQFPVESYLHVPFIKMLPRNAFGARIVPFALNLLATLIFIAILFRIAPLKSNWPALLLLLFPSAYVLMAGSAYFIPQHSSFTLLAAGALYLVMRMREGRPHPAAAPAAGFCAGLAFSNHMLAVPIVAVACAYALAGPRIEKPLRALALFALGLFAGLAPYLLAIWLIPGSYGSVSGVISPGEALRRFWGMALKSALAGAMGITPCLFPDNKHLLRLIPGAEQVFAAAWLLIMAAATILRARRLGLECIASRRLALEACDIFIGLSWIGLLTFLFSARALSHTYRYFLPAAWAFPFVVGCLYSRAPKSGRILTGALAVLLACYNIAASAALMREWGRPGFAAREASLFNLAPAIACLEKCGIRHAYASYWLNYRVTYESGGKITCSQPINERYPGWPLPYKKDVDAAAKAAYIMAPGMKFDPRRFEKDLQTMQVHCDRETFGQVTIYHDFISRAPASARPLPPSSLRASASHNGRDAPLMTDGNQRTFWRVDDTALKDLLIEVDLSGQELITGVVINHSGFPDEFVGLRGIMVLAENGWVSAVTQDISRARAPFEFLNGRPVYSDERIDWHFPPARARALRLLLHAPTVNCARTISEITVFCNGRE